MARGWGESEEIRKYSEMIKGNDVNFTWGPFLYPQRYAHSIFTKAIFLRSNNGKYRNGYKSLSWDGVVSLGSDLYCTEVNIRQLSYRK